MASKPQGTGGRGSARSSPPRSGQGGPARQVRIIGGQWKRTPLPVLDAEGLRPTPDRVRETVFNWLNHLLDGAWNSVKCLDLFAGTGALGFEAASRGAASVVMIEGNAAAVRQLEANADRLKAGQVTVRRGDALASVQALAARGARFQLIFLDPPYHQDWLVKILPLCSQLLADGGLVYAEAEMPLDGEETPDWLQGWTVARADKAGMVFYHLLHRNSAPEIEA
ncbi:16S rRNA (guanine(966)-N(2))-methyltransferase RsmD [Noviherbaspirillum aerium]|uniref:16S rRNA (guanine(966)-N(2))-methyltransferase RsmD n=1 Tax=Noviherbaspirillum aerium TaxID=2588497 RepID=UPI00124E014C|nr:16S rRNA (guanine(966)-N(2))-methyltransferase RsmD [Noviherbaspirillum aerium]